MPRILSEEERSLLGTFYLDTLAFDENKSRKDF